MTESTELAIIPTLKAELVYVPGGVDAVIENLTKEVRAIKTDISTASGRAAIASLAYKVARSKTALDDMGKELVAEWKAKANLVDADRRTVRERLDALRDEVRKPLDDWENAEKERVSAHEDALLTIETLGVLPSSEMTVEELDRRIAALTGMPPRNWQEFDRRAGETIKAVGDELTTRREAAVKRDTERAELERLRAEQVAREQRERDEKIAADAAERARQEETRKAEAEKTRLQADFGAALHKAAEKARIAEEQAAQAEVRRIEGENLARANALLAEKAANERAEKERLEAIENERRRVAAVEAERRAADDKRAADKKHRATVNNEAVDDLVARADITREQGIAVVTLIAKGAVRHTRIGY